jgi:hypothetical protein
VSVVLQIVIGVFVLAGLGYWLRGFARPAQRAYRQARDLAVVCPACGDRLNDAQLRALRDRNVRCPGSSRVSRPCPYYGERDLN